jgi:CRISPR-associated protein Cmr2
MSGEGQDFVLTLALGPVQGFIAAARRTRDLWAGSWLLSELAKAAARCWWEAKQKGHELELVFPAVTEGGELLPGSALSVGNKLRAVLRHATAKEASHLLAEARDAARARWRELAEEAKGKLGAGVNETIWQAQVDDYLETYAAWAVIEGGAEGEGYAAAVDAMERALAARKATRDFAPAALSAWDEDRCLPKCSLDGARETVLAKSGVARRKLRLADNEQLDVAGVIKRLAGDSGQFTPLTRVAAEPWLAAVAAEAPEELQKLAKAYEVLPQLELATRVTGNGNIYAGFPFDAQYCFPQRLGRAETQQEKEAMERVRAALRPLWKRFGQPVPYAVLLQADGDRMGELLDHLQRLGGHLAATRAISDFARRVPEIVRAHRGHAIYAGGDDVLALLPLDHALAAAQALANAFGEALRPVVPLHGRAPQPSLSVGCAVVHILEPLGLWREHAQAAERLAKGDALSREQRRNALGLRLAIRAGHLIERRLRWSESESFAALERWIAWFRTDTGERRLGSRPAYDLRDLAQRGEALYRHRARLVHSVRGDVALWLDWCQAEWKLLLERACTDRGRKLDKDVLEALQARFDGIFGWVEQSEPGSRVGQAIQGITAFAHELILARWLAARTSRDIGEART